MGLLAEFTMDDLGYAESTDELGVDIDYDYGCSVFVDVFLQEAMSTVPEDTGRLKGSIQASSDGDGCTCEADCEYAEYVEYGTCYMEGQPYFEPALAAALDAATPLWDEAVEEAMEEEAELLEEIENAERALAERAASRGNGGNSISGSIGNFLGMLIAVVILALIQGFINLVNSVGRSYGGRSSGGSRGSRSRGEDLKGKIDQIEVEIT